MPGYNRRGPLGEGPMSGRGEGMCNRGGMLKGCGLGRGGAMFNQFRSQVKEENPCKPDELASLKSDMAQLKSILETINKKITTLENR